LQDNGEAEGLLTLTITTIKPYLENSKTLYRKIVRTKNPPYCGLSQAISVLRWKVLLLPSRTE
jgi:hypothetical protein